MPRPRVRVGVKLLRFVVFPDCVGMQGRGRRLRRRVGRLPAVAGDPLPRGGSHGAAQVKVDDQHHQEQDAEGDTQVEQ